MLWKLGFLAFFTVAIVSVVLSTNVVVVRKFNSNTTIPQFTDLFSNRQCSSSTCPDRSSCAGGKCCMCQCLYDYPNVFLNRRNLRCMNYREINLISSANCQYSFRKTNQPLEVIPLTEHLSGKIKFTSDSVRVNCSVNGLSVDVWQFLDVNGRWENGMGNVFDVEFRTVGGRDRNKKDLTFLKWNAMLDAKYAGLLIKLSLSCAGRKVGCILAKINGTHTYNTSLITTSAPPSITSQQTSTNTPSAPVPDETTALPSPSASGEPKTSGAPIVGPTLRPVPGPTPETFLGPSTVPGSDSSRTIAPSRAAGRQQASDDEQTPNNQGSSSKAVWPTVGAIGGLICLICLVCLIVALYKRRKRWLAEKPAKDPEINSEAKLENNYQDPVYAELPDNAHTGSDFDNPMYCDPTEEQAIRRSKLDPLPALPADESNYQALDQNTRTTPGPSAPAPPPVSYPLDNGPQEESDYLNPDKEEETDAVDYDNPLVTNQVPMNNESSDYDNPPVQGNSPPSHTIKDLSNESSDYDNPPPVQGNSPPSHTIKDLSNESSDYDNPPVQSVPQGAPSESVSESTKDAVNEPEYLELQPEDSSL